MIKKIHHLAFLTKDIGKVRKVFEEAFGIPAFRDTRLSSRNVRVVIYKLGDVLVEFISPLSEEGAPYEYLKEHGEGFYHIALETDSIEDDISTLVSRGIDIPEQTPREGVEWKIVDIAPDSTLGIYFQLVSTK